MKKDSVYNKQILSLSKNTEFVRDIAKEKCQVIHRNPLCGDEIGLSITLDGDVIAAVSYRIRGCILAKAAAAYLAERCVGYTISQMELDYKNFIDFLNDDQDSPGQFSIFTPVRSHKSRHSCALLPFEAIISFLKDSPSG